MLELTSYYGAKFPTKIKPDETAPSDILEVCAYDRHFKVVVVIVDNGQDMLNRYCKEANKLVVCFNS